MAIQTNNPEDSRLRIVAASDFLPEPKTGYGGDVVGILISIGLIIGGASGTMVLRGTDSSTALVVAGFLFLAWDIISLLRKRSNNQKLEEKRSALGTRRYERECAVRKDERPLPAEVSVRIVCQKQLAAMDFAARLNGSAMTRDIKAGTYTGASDRVRNILSFGSLDLSVAFDVADPAARELVFELTRDKEGFGLILPDEVSFVQNLGA